MSAKFRRPHRPSKWKTGFLPKLESLERREVPTVTGPVNTGTATAFSPKYLDFGTATSPVAYRYQQASSNSVYSAAAGFGWLSSAGLTGVNRASGNDLTRDFVQGTDSTIVFDAPAGLYTVTASFGDSAVGHDSVGLFVEGKLAGTATTAANKVSSLTTVVSVTDGQITVRIADQGGTDPTFAVNSLAIKPALQATLTYSGPVNEGASSAQVTFSGITGGTAPYTYAFDYGGDGTFDVAYSANSKATVPATYLRDGPTSAKVIGRVRDFTGNFTDYTVFVPVQNVPPSPTATAPAAATVNTGVHFTGSATDPSVPDTAAGFTYLWNFGDGGTSTSASAHHTYTAPGTYTVTFRATDKDGGTATTTRTVVVNPTPGPSGSFIITGHDRIPNFGANPTVTAVADGNWSNPAIWSSGAVPVAGSVVSVGAGRTITYDHFSDVQVKTVVIEAGGSLRFRTDVNTRLTVVNLLVMAGGELRIGTAANPVLATVKAEVIFADIAIDTAVDPEQYGNGLIALGKVTTHGAVLSDSFVRLTTEALAGAITVVLSAPVSGWKAGDRLMFPDTRQLNWNERGAANFSGQWELVQLASVSADGRTLTLAAPLVHNHKGYRNAAGALEISPHVGNLTRNVVFKSQNMQGNRGHTMYTARAEVDIRYSQFGGLGRTKVTALDSTTLDANNNVTHLGTNQKGRYPVHFHHLMGPATTPANGYQYTFQGNSVFCPLTPMPFRWGIALHDAHYGLIKDNVLYNWAGAGIVGEDGSESFNVIEENFVVRSLAFNNTIETGWRMASERGYDDVGHEGVGFWFRGFNNYVRNNVASNATSYGYTYYAQYAHNPRVPLFPGADTSVAGQFQTHNIYNMPIRQFENNEAYGALPGGMTVWWLGTFGDLPVVNVGQSVIKGLKIWNVHNDAFFGYASNNLLVENMTVRCDYAHLAAGSSQVYGVRYIDYFARNVTFRGADIRGTYVGYSPSYNSAGTQTIENSYLEAYHNVMLRPMMTTGYRSDVIQPRHTVVRNVTFETPNVPNNAWGPKYDIYMNPSNENGSTNWVQLDQLMIYDYDGVAGDNFQAYYLEQAPGHILPVTVLNPDGTQHHTGAPLANLTNAQAWATYQVAWAGAVSPTSATRSKVRGFVRAF